MIRSTALLVVVLATAACGHRRDRDRDGETRLVPEREIAAMRKRLDASLAANRARRCVRPVLHGAAVPGPADPDSIALVEGSGAVAGCAAASGAGLRDALSLCPPDQPGSGIHPPCRGRPLDDPRSLEGDVLASTMACAMLDDAVTGAAAHDDACSPYLPGRRPPPHSMKGMLSIARAVEVRGRHLAQEGETAASLRLLLDWVRVCQDVGRGPVGFLPAMVGAAATDGALSQIEIVLASNRIRDAATLDELARTVDALIASEPMIADVLDGERIDIEATMIVPELDTPRSPKAGAGSDALPPTKSFTKSARDEIALGWIAMERTYEAERAACRPGATLESCVAALERTARAAEKAAGQVDLVKALRTPAAEVRRAAVDALRGIAADARIPYVRRLAFRRARLASLRAHVEALRVLAQSGTCPAEPAYSAPPLAPLLRPTALGGALTATRDAAGSIELRAPAWIQPSLRAWTVRCPP